ncbi:TPA: 6-O-methylguanine DNA methyltransferase [Candidatus Nomurabacteria bacterium]|nr:6-O-methylguanine DNA methyltransferase [Candidatus Nomurabacteria bacterium]
MNLFTQKVLEVVKKIPKGEVLTYAKVAGLAGNKKAPRAVGNILAKNTGKNIPCHRVIKSDGSVGMYNGLRGKSKLDILKREGVKFDKNKKLLFSRINLTSKI